LIGIRTGSSSETTTDQLIKTALDIKCIDCFVIDFGAIEKDEKNLLKAMMHFHYVILTTPSVVPYLQKLPHVYSDCAKLLIVESLEHYYADTRSLFEILV